MAIPKFPDFKKLEYSDREEIERITSIYPPYSDFNFVSMWSYNVHGDMKISKLNGNLIVRFNDYLTDEPFYSFLGNQEATDTGIKLLKLSSEEKIEPILRLVPEISISDLDKNIFNIREDRNNFDYVLAVEKLRSHDGSKRKFSTRRKLIHEFKKRKDFEILLLDMKKKETKDLIFNVFEKWEGEVGLERGNINHLKQALSRLFELDSMEKILSFGIFLNKILVGYSINEILPSGYVLGHFQQANLNVFGGVYALLMQEAADYVVHLGSKYINIEQDLGIEGLHKWKASYHPDFYLKKYIISMVDKPIE